MDQLRSPHRRAGAIGIAAARAAARTIPTAASAQDEVAQDDLAQVRVLHGAGDAPAVDVYAEGALVLEDVSFTEISDYLEVPAGTYRIQVVPTGASLEEGPVVIDAPVTLEPATSTTVAATGSLAEGIVPQVLADAPAPSTDGSQVRVVHFASDAPAVDIAPDGDAALIEGLAFPDTAGYVDLAAGEYDLEVRPAGSEDVAFDIPAIDLDAGTSYSVFAVGNLADGSFAVVPAPDAAVSGVRVGHFSADAPNVDVYADGAPLLTGVPFGTISDYLEVEPGTTRNLVAPAGATIAEGPVVIDAELTFEPGALTTVAATNELANITPVVIADQPAPVSDSAQVRVVHLSADAPRVDVAPDGSRRQEAIFKNVPFGKARAYETVPAGEYDLEVRPTGERRAAFDIPPVTLEDGKSYSAIAIGQLGGDSFDVILVEDASLT
jgi:hypothetical protein